MSLPRAAMDIEKLYAEISRDRKLTTDPIRRYKQGWRKPEKFFWHECC